MNQVKIFKALANDTRLQILEWLKDPLLHFKDDLGDAKPSCADPEKIGICVGFIQQKSGLSQSTISEYLSILQDAGLVTATRMGQWTYYKRNDRAIADVISGFVRYL